MVALIIRCSDLEHENGEWISGGYSRRCEARRNRHQSLWGKAERARPGPSMCCASELVRAWPVMLLRLSACIASQGLSVRQLSGLVKSRCRGFLRQPPWHRSGGGWRLVRWSHGMTCSVLAGRYNRVPLGGKVAQRCEVDVDLLPYSATRGLAFGFKSGRLCSSWVSSLSCPSESCNVGHGAPWLTKGNRPAVRWYRLLPAEAGH